MPLQKCYSILTFLKKTDKKTYILEEINIDAKKQKTSPTKVGDKTLSTF